MIYNSNSLVTNNLEKCKSPNHLLHEIFLTSFGIKFYWFVIIIKAIAVRYMGVTVNQTQIVVANNTHANTKNINFF